MKTWIVVGLALAAGAWALVFLRQGLDLGSDGLWLLGAEAVLNGTWGETIALTDGPGRYLGLGIGFLGLGSSAATLAAFQAALVAAWALLAGLGARRELGPWTWAFPVAAVAFAPIQLPTLWLIALAISLRSEASQGRWAVGICLAGLFSLGIPSGLAGILLLMIARGAGRRGDRRELLGWAVPSLGLAVAMGAALSGDALQQMLDGGFQSLRRLVDALPTAYRPWNPAPVFAALGTGEGLGPLFSGHAGWRSLSSALGPALTMAGLLFLLWRHHRRAPALTALAVLALLGLHLRPHDTTQHVLLALWPLLYLVRRSASRPLLLLTLVSIGIVLGPPLIERTWLTTNVARATARIWEQPRAEIVLGEARILNLERVVGSLPSTGVWFWPDRSALHFVYDQPLPTRWPGVPPDADAAETMVADLRAAPPSRVLLGLGSAIAARQLRDRAQPVWDFLRANYEVLGAVVDQPDEFRALRYVGESERNALPLARRLPDVEITITNDVSPPLARGMTVGQSFWTGDSDLEGIAVRWRSPEAMTERNIRVDIWMRDPDTGNFTTLLELFDVAVTIPGDGRRTYLQFEPVVDTANQELAITLELRDESGPPLQILWHRHDLGGEARDLYPSGTALLNGKPMPADLYLYTY